MVSLISNWCCRRGSYLHACLPTSCYAKMRSVKITKRELKIFIPSFMALFSSAFSLTMLFPFLPFLIEFLLPKVKEEDIGKYAGFIASSLFFGRFFGCYVWGALADKKGRKPVVIMSCLLIGLASAAFGFSVKLYMAIIFRFLVGLFNGVVGTIKAIVSESSNNQTQAFGMSLTICAWSLGLIIGPAVSGVLADPIGQYNLTISDPVVRGFLTKFPYSLPCLVNFVICVVSAVAVAVWMPETLGAKSSKVEGSVSEESNSQTSSVADDQQELLHNSSDHQHIDREVVRGVEDCVLQQGSEGTPTSSTDVEEITSIEVTGHSRDNTPGVRSHSRDKLAEDSEEVTATHGRRRKGPLLPYFNRRASFTPSFFKPSKSQLRRNRHSGLCRSGSCQRLVFAEEERRSVPHNPQAMEGGEEAEEQAGEEEEEEEEVAVVTGKVPSRLGQSLMKTLRNLKLFLTTRATVLSLLIYCIFSFALIGFDEVYPLWAAAAPHLGGLGWTLHEIGISQAISGAIFLPFTFFFPVLERRFGLICVYQISCIIAMICTVLLPNVHLVSPDTLNPLRWSLVVLLLFVNRVTNGNVFAATAIFINNSVEFDKLGEVNGLAHSLTALLRTFAPVFAGTIFSLSLSKEARRFGFPINYHLIFILFSLIMLSCNALGAGLPRSINRQKVATSPSESINRSESNSTSSSIHCNVETSSNREETSV